MGPLGRNTCRTVAQSRFYCLFCKKLTEVIQSIIFAWEDLTRSIIRIGRNTGEKHQILNVLLGFASVKTMKPHNDSVAPVVPPAPEDHSQQHWKEKPCCQHGGCQTCSSTSCWRWSCYPSSQLLHPSEGCYHLQNTDIWSTLNQAAACFARLWYYQHLTYQLFFPSPHGRGQLSSEQPLKPLFVYCSSDSPIHKVSAHPSATGPSLYFPAALF